MKKIFEKMKTYSFWVSFSGAVVVLATALSKAFGFSVENQAIEDVIMSIAGVLVVLGIVAMPIEEKKEKKDEDEVDRNDKEENK